MTPKAGDAEFATPSTSKRTREKSTHLPTQIAMLPTPTGRDYKDVGNLNNIPENALLGRKIGKSLGLKLQPAFVEWMMGFPLGWTDLNASAMPSSLPLRSKSSKELRKLKKEVANEEER